MLQDLMEGEPGYCGRDERKDCPEATKNHKDEVEERRAHPSKHFYSFEQWDERLAEICGRYNRSAQEGKRLAGLSPEEAFKQYWNVDDPPKWFGASCRYVLAHHKIPVNVSAEGVSFVVRGVKYRYLDEQLGRFTGRKLIAWFNPEIPELCTFTDSNLQNAITVARLNPVNALRMDDTYKTEVACRHAFVKYAKTRYRTLSANFTPVFRRTLVDKKSLELGQHIQKEHGAIEAQERRAQKTIEKGRRAARELNIQVHSEVLRRPETANASQGTQ